jgi:hypothetical protein
MDSKITTEEVRIIGSAFVRQTRCTEGAKEGMMLLLHRLGRKQPCQELSRDAYTTDMCRDHFIIDSDHRGNSTSLKESVHDP